LASSGSGGRAGAGLTEPVGDRLSGSVSREAQSLFDSSDSMTCIRKLLLHRRNKGMEPEPILAHRSQAKLRTGPCFFQFHRDRSSGHCLSVVFPPRTVFNRGFLPMRRTRLTLL